MKTEKTRHYVTAESRIIAKLRTVKNKRYNIRSYANYKSFSFGNGDNGNCRNHEFMDKADGVVKLQIPPHSWPTIWQRVSVFLK